VNVFIEMIVNSELVNFIILKSIKEGSFASDCFLIGIHHDITESENNDLLQNIGVMKGTYVPFPYSRLRLKRKSGTNTSAKIDL